MDGKTEFGHLPVVLHGSRHFFDGNRFAGCQSRVGWRSGLLRRHFVCLHGRVRLACPWEAIIMRALMEEKKDKERWGKTDNEMQRGARAC